MKKSKFVVIGGIIGGIVIYGRKLWIGYIKTLENYVKYKTYFRITNKWMELKERKKSLEEYFVENKIKTVAIYGMGALGKHLIEELKNSSLVKIVYGIDRSKEVVNNSIEVLSSEDNLSKVDAVIITPVLEFDEIKAGLCNKVKASFISLEEILNEIA